MYEKDEKYEDFDVWGVSTSKKRTKEYDYEMGNEAY